MTETKGKARLQVIQFVIPDTPLISIQYECNHLFLITTTNNNNYITPPKTPLYAPSCCNEIFKLSISHLKYQ